MTKAGSAREAKVPLYLIPCVINGMIRERGGKVYRISVVRICYHHYNISVRTRRLPRELMVREKIPVPVREPAGDGGDKSGDGCGAAV
jgi:hypothetical protein